MTCHECGDDVDDTEILSLDPVTNQDRWFHWECWKKRLTRAGTSDSLLLRTTS